MSVAVRPLSVSTAAASNQSKFFYRLTQLNRWVAPFAIAGILVGCAPAATLQTTAPQMPVDVTTTAAAVETQPLTELPPIPMLDDDAAAQASAGPADQKGVASWYGPGFHGRLTANGERYNMGELTAAHRQYAFGTRLCVRSPSGKTVVVRVNDRGPYAKGRVIDLSKAAAQELGMLGVGIKRVEIWKLDEGENECPDSVVAQG